MKKEDFVKKYKGAFPDVHGRTNWKTWTDIEKDMANDLDSFYKEHTTIDNNMNKQADNKQVDIFDDPSCTHCPYCGSRKKTWKKPLVGIAVVELIRLYQLYKIDLESVHISKFSKQRSNFYTLKYWGLIEGSEKVEGKRTAGLWKPTELGIDFILNKVEIPSYAETLNNKLQKLSGETTNIIKVLGKKFNYDELINDSEWYNL